MEDFKDIVEEVKSRSDIAEIISSYINLKPSGTNYKGLCPFHGEKTPSFYVNTTKQIFKCFGCGEGGDIISFIMKIENLDFIDSVKFLAEKCGVIIDQDIDENTKNRLNKIKKFQEMNTEAARFFYFSLMEKNENSGITYLKKRGLDEKTIKVFGLGYAQNSWNSLMNYMVSKGFSLEELVECGLIVYNSNKNSYYDKYRNRVMFPIFDYKSNIIGFGGRVLDDSVPKYLNSPESDIFNKRLNLFGLNLARKNIGSSKQLILVEGYMDLISLYQFGIRNVVATLGTSLTKEQAILIKRYADEVIISYDSDDAGVVATLRAIDILEIENIKVKVLNLQDSKDPDEYIRANGMASMMSAIDNSVESTRFKIDKISKAFNLNDRKEAMNFLKEVVSVIRNIRSPIELDYYVNLLAQMTSTNREIIMTEAFGESRYNKYKSENKSRFKSNSKNNKNNNLLLDGARNNMLNQPKMTTSSVRKIDDAILNVERYIIKMMMQNSKAREIVPLKIEIDDFESEISKKLYSLVLNSSNKGIIRIEELIDEKSDINYFKKLDGIALDIELFDNISEIEKVINNFLKYKYNKKIDQLSKRQKILEDRIKTMEKDTKETNEANLEIMKITLSILELNKKLKSL